jgi:hypothetical protein
MIRNEPDPTIDLHKLEQEIQSYRDEITLSNQWYLREAYYDFGGVTDPHYCIIFCNNVDDPGDIVMDAPLLATNRQELGYVNLTCFTIANNREYWQPVGPELLIQRLERFLTMNRENYLQPPGGTGDLYGASNPHPQFRGMRFLYQLGSPSRCITGTGPAMFAGTGSCGALRGQLLGDNQSPLQGVTVELVLQQENNNNPTLLTRETGENGLFWFSRVPAGTYNLRVHGEERVYGIRVLKDEPEPFGIVEGRLYHQQGHPLVGVSLHLQAPDGEVFPVLSGSDGRFRSASLPAFPYTLRIPGFLFTAAVSVVCDAVIGGTLVRENNGGVLPGKTVVLNQGGSEVSRTDTDSYGNFRFDHLCGGRYSVEVPGYRLYARSVTPGSIEGTITGVTEPVTIELLVREEVAASTSSMTGGAFRFDNLTPGGYHLRSPGLLLKKEEV